MVWKCYAVGEAAASCVGAEWKGRRLKRYISMWSISKSSLTGARKLILWWRGRRGMSGDGGACAPDVENNFFGSRKGCEGPPHSVLAV